MQTARPVNRVLKYAVILGDLCALNLLIALFFFLGRVLKFEEAFE